MRAPKCGRALLAIALALVAAAFAPSASAQCGANRSTCSACHDGARASYAADAAWHKDHCFADVCAVCHGGAPDAPAAAAAHVGLVAPLAGDTQCISCHGDASAALARRYADAADAADAGATTQPAQPARTTSAPSSPAPRDVGSNDVPATILAALIGALGLGWVASRERQTLRRWRDSWMHAGKMSPSNDERS